MSAYTDRKAGEIAEAAKDWKHFNRWLHIQTAGIEPDSDEELEAREEELIDRMGNREQFYRALFRIALAGRDDPCTDWNAALGWTPDDWDEAVGRCLTAETAARKLCDMLYDPYRAVGRICPECNMQMASHQQECCD